MKILYDTGWAAPPLPAEPQLAGDVHCDVVVIGGGGGGMAAAIRLAESGADVVLVEARTLGAGASGRNAGYITNSIAADPEMLDHLVEPTACGRCTATRRTPSTSPRAPSTNTGSNADT